MANREDVFAAVAAVLVEKRIFEEKSAPMKIAAKVTGASPYNAFPDRITDDTVSLVVGALENLDRKNLLPNAKMIGLEGLMHGSAKQDLINALNTIGKEAGGKAVAELVQERLAAASRPILSAVDRARNEAQEDRARAIDQAAYRDPKGQNTTRQQIIAQGETQKGGCVTDDPPDHGLGSVRAKPMAKGQSCAR